VPGARKGSGEGASPKPESGSFSEAPSPPPVADVDDLAPQQEEGSEESEVALKAERDEYLALAQRTQADFENYRKRAGREAADAEARGRGALARSLLPVLDNLERALAAAEPIDRTAPNHLAHGVKLVYEELAGVLRGAGIESYSPQGEAFDPDWHEAMMTRPGEEGRVLEVLEKGYRLNSQVLRPARVVVGAAGE
jgi:molecular chaperone GrpE